jgi:hypothetical protein
MSVTSRGILSFRDIKKKRGRGRERERERPVCAHSGQRRCVPHGRSQACPPCSRPHTCCAPRCSSTPACVCVCVREREREREIEREREREREYIHTHVRVFVLYTYIHTYERDRWRGSVCAHESVRVCACEREGRGGCQIYRQAGMITLYRLAAISAGRYMCVRGGGC